MISKRTRIMHFYKRWNIPLDREEELEKFKNRLLAAFDFSIGKYITERPSISKKFAFTIGHRQPVRSVTGLKLTYQRMEETGSIFGASFSETKVYHGIVSAPDEQSLIFALQCLFWILEEQKYAKLETLVQAVREAIDASVLVNIKIARRGHRVTLYPEGAKLLDKGLVNDSLLWLKSHKAAAKHFETALDIYLKKETGRYRNLLDELRSSLEKLVRSIIGNRKSLENQKNLLPAG